MSFATQPLETDLLFPLPDGQEWDPYTIHTHYFGFHVPEAAICAFAYVRWMPAFPLSQGGVCLFQGLDNVHVTDMAYSDYEMTMPWPQVEGNVITTPNGLRIEFLEPGAKARVSYTSPDGGTRFDVLQTAVTPLLARGHVVPGEEAHHDDPARQPGGSEQFMHVTGTLVLRGEEHAVDCFHVRDRSWRQVRTERRGLVDFPAVGWSPMYFGEDLVFNQISFEPLDTDPGWKGGFEIPADKRTHHFAWIIEDGEPREIVRVRRNVHEYHPQLYTPLRQDVEAEDDRGRVYRFEGEALAAANLPAWPNATFRDGLFRWQDERGRVAHCTYQELWFDTYQHAMRRHLAGVSVG